MYLQYLRYSSLALPLHAVTFCTKLVLLLVCSAPYWVCFRTDPIFCLVWSVIVTGLEQIEVPKENVVSLQEKLNKTKPANIGVAI